MVITEKRLPSFKRCLSCIFSIINTFSLFLFFPDKGIFTHMDEVNLERGGNKHDLRSKPCAN